MRRLGALFCFALLGSLGLPAVAAGAAAPSEPSEPVVVRFDPGASASERAAELDASGLAVVDELTGSDFVLAVPESTAAPDAGGAIAEVTPLVTYRALGVPNDPYYRYQWHLPIIDAPSAWDVTTGTDTVIAVLDTGVAYEDYETFRRAPDMAGTSFAAGWDFIVGDAHPNDENGHGTHVASTIAANTSNALGVSGAAPGVTIMPLRVLDAAGGGSDWAAADALRWAADQGADVANMSFGSAMASSVMADAVAYARGKGVTVVAASGNGADRIGIDVSYPARIDGVIAVGAVRYDLARSPYSNYGPLLDLVAPGGDMSVNQNGDQYPDGILAETFIGGDPTDFAYAFLEGTSMAAPQVSAVAALLAARGASGPDAIEDILTSTARDLGPAGRDDEYGFGLVQAGAAVRAPLPADQPPAGPTVQGIENACPSDRTPPPDFGDVSGSIHAAAIGCVAWWEVASGTTATTFEPNGRVTRAQLASFVARELAAAGMTLPASPPDAFTDDETSVHELRINQLAALGVVQGRGGTTYSPGAAVTRAEMATFLVRAHDIIAMSPLPVGPDAFSDDNSSVHEPNIDKVAAAGLAAGTTATTFAPTSPVLRGQMATFLARLLDRLVQTGITAAR